MEYTKNLKLKQPEYTDVANIADINANMATIDTAFENLQNADTNHTSNFSNPHKVTKAQVGLGNVDDTADKDKNVLSASKLTNAVKLNGITFDGTKDIEIPATPKRTSLASDADLNEITAQGEYFASYGNTCINKPNNVKGFALKVYWNIVGSTSAITQVLYPSIGAIPMCFIRKGNSNGWADWQEVSTVGHTHTQADIPDFNKPTPLKLLEDATEIDLNNIKTTGIYTSVTQTKYLNCPATLVTDSSGKQGYAFSLIVLGSRVYGTKDTISYYTQICIDSFGGQGQNQTWIRTYYGSSGWTAWYTFYSSKNKPTLADITGSAVLPVSKGGTGYSTISAGYALVGNGTAQQLDTRYIRSNILQNSNDLVTSGAVYTALNTKADKEKISEFEESLSYTDESIAELKETLNKTCYLVGAKDSDANLLMYCDVKCTGISDNIAIQKLIDTVPEGSEIKFLAGNYNLKDSLKINKSLSLIGSGLNTVFTATYLSSSKVLTDTSIFWINSIGADNIVENIQISNLKISKGLCRLDGKYIAGDGTEFSSEYPGYTDSTRGALVAGNVIKLKLDSVQFENKLTTGSTSMIRCTGSTTKIWTIYLRDCFHTNNGSFNGYFIDTGAGSFNTNFTTLTLALSGCDSTGSLCINLPAKENKDKVLDNSFNVKYYIKGAEE